MVEINLFSKELTKLKTRQRIKQLTWQLTLAAVLGLAILLVGLSSFSLIVSKRNQATSRKIDQLKNEIESLRPIESKQIYLLSKIDTFADLLKTQEKHQAIAETVFALLPDGASLKGFQVSDTGVINLSGSVPNYETLLKLLDRIGKSQSLNVPITTAKVNSISLGLNSINFAIDVALRVN